jgi:hypothetical protein
VYESAVVSTPAVAKPKPSQHMVHPNSLLARISRDPETKAAHKAWRRKCDGDHQAMEQANRRGWV